MYKIIDKCRVCSNHNLEVVLDLGSQMLTGVFPDHKDQEITVGPLQLVKCTGGIECCGLLQLRHSFDASEMYGDNYGYRSGLNPSMVRHLEEKVNRITKMVDLTTKDFVLDIGSNDGTTLKAYPDEASLIGIDPTGSKFSAYYPDHVKLIPDFFSADAIRAYIGENKFKVITSFSMFYDLENPLGFMEDIHGLLSEDGIWVFEQSYMPEMLKTNSYDTICHEHLEFYSLSTIKWMCDKVGFRIIDVQLNKVNGGSFSVTVGKCTEVTVNIDTVNAILADEDSLGLNGLSPYLAFAERVVESKRQLTSFISEARQGGKTIGAIGASTKGNVLLQYCEFSVDDIVSVGEVNQEKFGKFTPGTWLPIMCEDELLKQNLDYLVVLPWHFREHFMESEKFQNSVLVFPLPTLEIVNRRLKST